MLEGNSALNEVVSQLSSYSKTIGTAVNEWEGYPAAASNFESAAGAVGVSVNLPTISLEIPLIVQSIDTVIESINEFMDNLQSTAEVIGAKLSDFNINPDIKSGYASSTDTSSLTSLIDGSINGDSTIGGFSYVLDDGTCIVWYGGGEYSDYDDYIKAVQDKAGEDFDLANVKILIKSNNTPIAWVDSDRIVIESKQDVSTPTGVTPTDGSSVIVTTPNTDSSSTSSEQNTNDHLGSGETIGGIVEFNIANNGIDASKYNGDTFTVDGVTYPLYYQHDNKYSDESYGNSTLYSEGCGVFSLATVVSGLTGEVVTPEDISSDAANHFSSTDEYEILNTGSAYPGIFSDDFLEKNYGVNSESFSSITGEERCKNMDIVQEQLDQGKAVIGSIGIGSSGGHIVALLPVSEEKKAEGYNFYLYDSISESSGGSGYYSSINDFYDNVNYYSGQANDFGARYVIY